MRVLTIGTFDLYHPGHTNLFYRAAKYGPLTVGVNSDQFVTDYKGPPAETEEQRAAHVAGSLSVDEVVFNDGPGIDLIRELRPNLLVVGSDWLGKDYPGQLGTTASELAYLGVAVLFLPRTPGYSSTALRQAS